MVMEYGTTSSWASSTSARRASSKPCSPANQHVASAQLRVPIPQFKVCQRSHQCTVSTLPASDVGLARQHGSRGSAESQLKAYTHYHEREDDLR